MGSQVWVGVTRDALSVLSGGINTEPSDILIWPMSWWSITWKRHFSRWWELLEHPVNAESTKNLRITYNIAFRM